MSGGESTMHAASLALVAAASINSRLTDRQATGKVVATV